MGKLSRALLSLLLSFASIPPVEAVHGPVQIIPAGINVNSATAVNFAALFGHAGNTNATENNVKTMAPSDGVFRDLRVTVETAPDNGAGVDTIAFNVHLNATDTALGCTITDTETTCTDSDEVAVSAAQELSMETTPGNTPAVGVTKWTLTFVATTGGETIISGGTGTTNLGTGATNYFFPGASGTAGTTEANAELVFPTAGTLKNLYIELSGSPNNGGGTQSYTFTTRLNAATPGTPLDCAISETATTCNDTTATYTIAAGDRIAIESVPANTPTARLAWVGLTFIPDVDGEFVIPLKPSDGLDAASTTYNRVIASNSSWSTTSNVREQQASRLVVKAMYVRISSDPDNGAGTQTFDLTLQDDAASTAATVQLSETETADNITGLSIEVALDSLIRTECVPGGTPDITGFLSVSYLAFLTPRRITGGGD